MAVALHLCRPLHESPQVVAFPPHELPEFQEADLGHLHAAVGFNPPKQIGAAPGRETMSAGCIPEKTEDVAHIYVMIIRKPATCTNYRALEAKRSPTRRARIPFLPEDLIVHVQ